MKIMTVVGTRPELIKMTCCIRQFDRFFEHILVHTGQNYDYELIKYFSGFRYKRTGLFFELYTESPARAIGDIIAKTDMIIKDLKPDAFVVYGDTNSCLLLVLSGIRFQFFILRQGIDVLIPAFQKR